MDRKWRVIPLLGLLAGCSEPAPPVVAAPAAMERQYDQAQLAQGRALFRQHCAQCHGSDAQGAFNWRVQQADGSFPPPPLDGTGHAWHHPRAMLHHVIRNGSPGGGKMPAWGGKLSDAEIATIITWFQSLWPDEVYSAWLGIEQRARQARRGD